VASGRNERKRVMVKKGREIIRQNRMLEGKFKNATSVKKAEPLSQQLFTSLTDAEWKKKYSYILIGCVKYYNAIII